MLSIALDRHSGMTPFSEGFPLQGSNSFISVGTSYWNGKQQSLKIIFIKLSYHVLNIILCQILFDVLLG